MRFTYYTGINFDDETSRRTKASIEDLGAVGTYSVLSKAASRRGKAVSDFPSEDTAAIVRDSQISLQSFAFL
jgi:hypothetical protein